LHCKSHRNADRLQIFEVMTIPNEKTGNSAILNANSKRSGYISGFILIWEASLSASYRTAHDMHAIWLRPSLKSCESEAQEYSIARLIDERSICAIRAIRCLYLYREFFNDAPSRCYFSKLKKTLQLRYYYS